MNIIKEEGMIMKEFVKAREAELKYHRDTAAKDQVFVSRGDYIK